ncbi:MAG TPA: phosphodiester glycosidase family protein [Armatimonadota bacterium]|jgi:uncharacterized protein YigE (DUF2233 family)
MTLRRTLGCLGALVAVSVAGWWIYHREDLRPAAPLRNALENARPAAGAETTLSPGRQEAPPPVATRGWEPVAPGVDLRVQSLAQGLAWLTAVRLDPKQVRVEVVDRAATKQEPITARALAEQQGALAAINGGYFDEQWRPLGLLIHKGKQTHPLRRADWGIFSVGPRGAQITHTRQGVPRGAQEALQCGPRLVIAGKVPQFKPGDSVRAGIGITAQGQVVLAVTTRGSLSLRDWARALQAVGCVDAMNLDGGPSSQLYLKAGKTTRDLPGSYGVPSLLLVKNGPTRLR